VIAGADLDDEFDAIVGKFSAAIANGDISGSAGILLSQLEASKEHMDVVLNVTSTCVIGAGGWADYSGPPPIPFCIIPVPVISQTPAWEVSHVYWVCNNTGTGTGTFRIDWGEVDTGGAAGVWSQVSSVATGTLTNAVANGDLNAGTATLGTTTLTQSTGVRSLALIATGADATTMDNTTQGANEEFLSVTVRIRRDISAS